MTKSDPKGKDITPGPLLKADLVWGRSWEAVPSILLCQYSSKKVCYFDPATATILKNEDPWYALPNSLPNFDLNIDEGRKWSPIN